jgi:hypothetical protein
MANAELPSSSGYRMDINMMHASRRQIERHGLRVMIRAADVVPRRESSALGPQGVKTLLRHRWGDRLRPACQAWGGARALKGRWPNEAGSHAASGHCRISALARLMLAQTAQKSTETSAGFCGDGSAPLVTSVV